MSTWDNDDVHRIVTSFWVKPSSTDGQDWEARFEDYRGSFDHRYPPCGHGSTEIEAIADLLKQEAENVEWLAFHDF